ncbi:MAG: hypothetical protein COA88_14530 [Kordia sp.]|nr:MAG: hypothetical protein COA88_14530 [Kordia sp.]
MAKFKVKTKRVYQETEKAIVILTSGYGGEFVPIPKSQISASKTVKDDLGDWLYLEVKDWLYDKIKGDLSKISAGDFIILT